MSEKEYKYSFKRPEIINCSQCPCFHSRPIAGDVCVEMVKYVDVDPFTEIPTWCRLEKEEVKEGEG
jgi:hypothetical protein